jgi:DNA-binding transcriptional MerR regulator
MACGLIRALLRGKTAAQRALSRNPHGGITQAGAAASYSGSAMHDIQRDRKIKALRRKGVPVREIAQAFQLSHGRVSQIANGKLSKRGPSQPRKAREAPPPKPQPAPKHDVAKEDRQIAAAAVASIVAQLPPQDRCLVLVNVLRAVRDQWQATRQIAV